MVFEKKYDSKVKEKYWRDFWEDNKIYQFDINSDKEIYSIDTPPPTISGKMHVGHAFSYSQQDFIARYKRLKGFNVFYPFGTDDNGLATEKSVEKEKNVNLRKVDRQTAINIVQDYLEIERPKFIQDWKNIGISCDFDLYYSTINEYSQKISQETFLYLVENGLIERRKGPIMWDRKFQTAIAQAELEDVTRKAYLSYIKAKIVNSNNTYMVYATTRPELCFAVLGMSVEDNGDYVKLKVNNEFWICSSKTYEEKFSDFDYEVVEKLKGHNFIGEKVLIPVVNREIEISHDISVKADFGTGIAYFCSYGGLEDIEWVSRHGVLPIELLEKDGKLNDLGGKYKGLIAEDARKLIIEDLEKENFLIKKELKEQVVNVYERSGLEIEYIVSNQWYVKYLDKKEYFWEMAQKFNWKPEFMKYRLENWIKGLNWDWGFSRQRHYGIPIPVWYCKKCGEKHFPQKKDLPVDPLNDVCSYDKCLNCSNDEFIAESDVFDTWFTSSSSPILASKLLGDEVFNKVFPMSLRPQAHDIIDFWLFYTMAKTNLIYDENPFRDVIISGWVLDPQGKKMSKSKGNTISPQEMVEKYSSDAIRYAAASTKLGYDMPFQEKELQTGIKVVNKLYNANKFASMLLTNFTFEDINFNFDELNSIDKWIISKLNVVFDISTKALDNYDYAKAKSEIDLFFMRDVADNYIEIVKERLWKPDVFGNGETKKAQKALYYVLFNVLKGFSIYLPYVCEDIYNNFYINYEKVNSIHSTNWPCVNNNHINDDILMGGDLFVAIISYVRKNKSEKQLSIKAELKKLIIDCPDEYIGFIQNSILDLKAVLNVSEIVFDRANGETDLKNLKIEIFYN